SLGINSTVFIQFAIFLVTFLFLKEFVFEAYNKALEQRTHRTKGGEELALDIQKETESLKTQFEIKAREINSEITKVFDKHRTESSKEVDKVVGSARAEANALIEASRERISKEVSTAKESMNNEVPKLAEAMTARLLGRNA
ncbi:MAG: hypothetical protein AB7H97_15610, partial [Pseudobdellovibrionaceae bacterium]